MRAPIIRFALICLSKIARESTLDRIKKQFNIQSVRRNKMTDVEKAVIVNQTLDDDDPLGNIGVRDLQLRLAKKDCFVERSVPLPLCFQPSLLTVLQ